MKPNSTLLQGGWIYKIPLSMKQHVHCSVKDVDSLLSELSEDEIIDHINKELLVRRVIKIPNSIYLKITFMNSEAADKVVQEGLQTHFQRFENRNIEKEMFAPVVPCYWCYSCEYLKTNCPKSIDYKIC